MLGASLGIEVFHPWFCVTTPISLISVGYHLELHKFIKNIIRYQVSYFMSLDVHNNCLSYLVNDDGMMVITMSNMYVIPNNNLQ